MLRHVATLLVLCAPAWATPAHRQPTPDSVRSGAEATPPGRADAAADPGKPSEGQDGGDARRRDWDRKAKKSLGGVCRGC